MRHKPVTLIPLALAIVLTSPVIGWPQTTPPARTAATGYLSAAETPDVIRITPPAPVAGDARDILDLEIFRRTRSLEASPRWTLAVSDNDITVAALLNDFSCAAGATLNATDTPRVSALITRVFRDVTTAFTLVKNAYPQRKRPFLSEQGAVCLATANLANNPDYPSGHTAVGWSVALITAELLPDRATDIMIRGRAFGESRVICGVHNASAIDGGHVVADTIVAALHGNAAFRNDLDAARAELAAIRLNPPPAKSAMCATEGEMIARRPY